MKPLQKISNVINVVFILTLLLSCESNIGKVKDTETPQGLSSLIGTEWVHSDDTDPESRNWFHVYHSPTHFYNDFDGSEFEVEFPAVIKFLENGIIDEPTYKYYWFDYYNKKYYMGQYYRYSYNEPYLSIVMDNAFQGLHPSEVQIESVEEVQKKWNLCPLTIDEPMCDPSKCKNSRPGVYPYSHCGCANSYRFLGKVEGDTMHLQQKGRLDTNSDFTILRDIYLIRRK